MLFCKGIHLLGVARGGGGEGWEGGREHLNSLTTTISGHATENGNGNLRRRKRNQLHPQTGAGGEKKSALSLAGRLRVASENLIFSTQHGFHPRTLPARPIPAHRTEKDATRRLHRRHFSSNTKAAAREGGKKPSSFPTLFSPILGTSGGGDWSSANRLFVVVFVFDG